MFLGTLKLRGMGNTSGTAHRFGEFLRRLKVCLTRTGAVYVVGGRWEVFFAASEVFNS